MPAERVQIAFVSDRESPDRDAVDPLTRDPRLIFPGDVIAGVRGQYVDISVTREMLGDVPRVELCTTVDRVTVSLDDDRQLHCSSSDPPLLSDGPKSEDVSAGGAEGAPGIDVADCAG